MSNSRFGHHPDPAIDFEIEVTEIESIIESARLGLTGPKHAADRAGLERRIELAMLFQVGGDPSCCAAKAKLRLAAPQVEGLTSGEGWQLVPVEPTNEMLEASADAWTLQCSGYPPEEGHYKFMRGLWSAMLAASPKATVTASAREDAVEAAARAMCDRVNGIGDYDENIAQRRTGWVAQARAGIAAYLASLTDSGTAATIGGERA